MGDWVYNKSNFVLDANPVHEICQKYQNLKQWEGFSKVENKEDASLFQLGLALTKLANREIALGLAKKLFGICPTEELAVRIINIHGSSNIKASN